MSVAKRVPREPTEAMRTAAYHTYGATLYSTPFTGSESLRLQGWAECGLAIYQAVYDAAPCDAAPCDAAASVQTDHESQPAKAGDAAGKSTDASPCECGHSKRVHVARGGYWPCPMEDCGCRHYRESALAAQPEQPAAQPVACPQCLDTGVARYPYCTTCGKRAAAPIEAPPRDEQDAKRYRWLAGDGDRAKWLLNTYSGCEVEGYIDNALRAAAQTGEPPRS